MNKNESKYFSTGSRMIDAFITILEHKEFEYITIKEICSLAKVNRSTFYLHFSNTSDLLEESIYRLNESFNKHLVTENKKFNINETKDLKSLFFINDKFLIPYLNFVKENKNIYKALKGNPRLFNVTATYDNLNKNLFSPILTRFNIEEKWHKYILDFYITGLSSIIFNWIDGDCLYEIDEIANLIKELIVYYDKKIN